MYKTEFIKNNNSDPLPIVYGQLRGIILYQIQRVVAISIAVCARLRQFNLK